MSAPEDLENSTTDDGHTLPIIQDLKMEHPVLSDHVKQTATTFLDPEEALKNLQLLSTEHEQLKKKYIKESSERKQLYNEVIELKGNIRVYCRCRPINQTETSNGCNSVVEFDPSLENELQVICSDSSKKPFKFDHVFKPDDNQDAVFARTKPIVTSVLDGYNVCIFAYGQTGTGKTFTMEGTQDCRGVNYRTVEELFRVSEERSGVMRYNLSVSMLEVYNEKIRDLLADNSSNQQAKKLEIKQSAEGTQEVPGLVEARVSETQDVWELLKSGSRVRSVGSTSANEMSSRSHCLLRVTVKGSNLINGQSTKSHLWLVDLAGSERVGRIEVEGERLKESQFINRSLSSLGDVIAALAAKKAHVPYRNSKLTHILQSSLGGDCKTLMFVQISPSSSDLGETLCSLNFATRVRGIEGGPARKQTDLSELYKYKQMAEKSKHDEKETSKLQESVHSLQMRLATREHICKNLQDKVRDLESQLAEERKTRLKLESKLNSGASSSSAASSFPSLKPPQQKTMMEKKPPLAPRLRMPLRKITNSLLPPPSPAAAPSPHANGKENLAAKMSARSLFAPRRTSMVAQTTASQSFKPKRRVSIATFRPEPATTPLHPSAARFQGEGAATPRDPRRARYSRLFTPLHEERETTSFAQRSSRFMGSPPPRPVQRPAAIALQRKTVVWSPLRLRNMRQQFNRRPSLLPIRSSSSME